MLEWDKIGKFIAELRREKGLTQVQLSELLYTSRENVSKWERGVNCPTTETILRLSEIFNVTVNELLSAERKTVDNVDTIENVVVDVLTESAERRKRIIIRTIILITAFVLLFFLYYFVNSYNTLFVYKVGGVSENFSSTNGIVIFSKNKSYLKLGEVKSDKNIKPDKIELHYKDAAGEDVKIYETYSENYVLTSLYGYDEYFSYENMSFIIKTSYLKIFHDGQEEILKLKFERSMHNSFLIFSPEVNGGKDEVNTKNSDTIQKIEKYFNNNFQYNSDDKIYSYNDNGIKIEYSVDTKNLVIFENKDNKLYSIEYNFKLSTLIYTEYVNNSQEISFVYNTESKDCKEGKCNEEKINYFLDNYYNKYVGKN